MGSDVRSADRTTGALLVVLALVCFREMARIGGKWDGAGTMPLIVGVIFSVTGIILLVFPSREATAVRWPGREELVSIGVISGAFALYLGFLNWLGYAIGTWLFLAVVAKYISPSRLSVILIWTGVVAIGTYILFKKYLFMYLPEGLIGI